MYNSKIGDKPGENQNRACQFSCETSCGKSCEVACKGTCEIFNGSTDVDESTIK